MRNNLAPALIGSALLHVAVFGFALWKWPTQTREVLTAVPVQIVSEMPAMAPAPVAPPTVEATPEPAVEELPPEPTPPTPEPPKPTPQPTPPKPQPKPDPKAVKTDKTPPKKTQEASVDPLALVKDMAKKGTRRQQDVAPADAQGSSRAGPAKVDTGPAIIALAAKLNELWLPNCAAKDADKVVIKMRFKLSSRGRVVDGPHWINENSDGVWMAASQRARAAIGKGEPYTELPPEMFNQQITVNFIGANAC